MLCLLLVTQFVVLLAYALGTFAQNGPTGWSASPFNPPAFPLAVRSPNLNTWLPQGNSPQTLSESWPRIWSINAITGWYALVSVDGQAYRISGATDVANVATANQTAVEFTSTRTSFLFATGGMQINASFFSPVEPLDLVRQSLPFSYLTMSAKSVDGTAHNLRMYSDISGEFITADTTQLAQWSSREDGQYVILSMKPVTQKQYSEDAGIAQDATEYYAFKKIDGTTVSWAISNDTVNRATAANPNTTLGNTTQLSPRPVQDSLNNWTTLGIAVDWGNVDSTPQPAVWAIGLVRSPSVQYRTRSGLEDRYPYFLSNYTDAEAAMKAFLDDFPRAQSAAETFDSQILDAGQQFSAEYADLLALTVRQVMGCMDITLSKSSDGSWNMSDAKVFTKNMGGIGTDVLGSTLSVNTVDTLYSAFPAFLYLNPELGGYMLSPLLEYQNSPAYTLSYSARNIGTTYPNATADGINNSHDYGVEETANMLIMTLAYSQRSGNGAFLKHHYPLLKNWAEYLENNTLTPSNQRSADFISDDVSPKNNQTNLALKGIIGIACMAKIAEIEGASTSDDQKRFNNSAQSYISKWKDDALSSDQSYIELTYGQSDTHGLIYNLFADPLLQLRLVPVSVYDILDSLYAKIITDAPYGIPLENSIPNRTMTNWMVFAASTVSDPATRNSMIDLIHKYAASNENNAPFPSTYDPSSGSVSAASNSGINSPASGAIFSLLAMNTSIHDSMNPSLNTSSGKSKSPAGAIAGGAIGGIILLILIALVARFCLRRWRNVEAHLSHETRITPIVLGCNESTPTQPSQIPRMITMADEGTLHQTLINKRAQDSAHSQSPSGGNEQGPSPNRSTSADVSSTHQLGQSRSLTGRWQGVGEDREQLQADVSSLRRELERLRHDLNDLPPSYSDPGVA